MGNPRAVIFVNGDLVDPIAVRAMLRPDDILVAADGGLRHIDALGLQPHRLVGDLDSLEPGRLAELEAAGVRIDRYPVEKDESDLELALTSLAAEGCQEIRVVAALGGRLDQTLANIYLLDLPGLETIDVHLDDGREEILIIRDSAVVSGTPGDTLSLLAMDGCTKGIVTRGLKYPLTNESLCPNRTRGISNVMETDQAEITLRTGRLLCIHTRQASPAQGKGG